MKKNIFLLLSHSLIATSKTFLSVEVISFFVMAPLYIFFRRYDKILIYKMEKIKHEMKNTLHRCF